MTFALTPFKQLVQSQKLFHVFALSHEIQDKINIVHDNRSYLNDRDTNLEDEIFSFPPGRRDFDTNGASNIHGI